MAQQNELFSPAEVEVKKSCKQCAFFHDYSSTYKECLQDKKYPIVLRSLEPCKKFSLRSLMQYTKGGADDAIINKSGDYNGL